MCAQIRLGSGKQRRGGLHWQRSSVHGCPALAAVCLKGEIYFTAGTSATELICLSHKSPLPPSFAYSLLRTGLGVGMAHISSVTLQSLCQDCPAEKRRATFCSPHTHTLSLICTPLLTKRTVVPPICIQIPLSNVLCIWRWTCLYVDWTCAISITFLLLGWNWLTSESHLASLVSLAWALASFNPSQQGWALRHHRS